MRKSIKSGGAQRPSPHQIVEQLSKQQPKDDAEFLGSLSTLAPSDSDPLLVPHGLDDPSPAAIENDDWMRMRYGWVP